MRFKRHMSANLEGILRNNVGRKINFIDDENGKTLTDKQARAEIARLLSLGHKLMPCGDCDGFDPFGGGCPGHVIEEEPIAEPQPSNTLN